MVGSLEARIRRLEHIVLRRGRIRPEMMRADHYDASRRLD
jgi:hypothetical protein